MRGRLSGATPTTGRGALPAAAPAWLGAQTVSMQAMFAGAVTTQRMVTLKSAVWMPLPQAVPPGPQPRSAQGSYAHGPTFGGAVHVQLPPLGRLFYLRQRNELPVPIGTAGNGPGNVSAMTTARAGGGSSSSRVPVVARFQQWKKGMGGRWVTASPFVVPRWPIIGSTKNTGTGQG